MARPLDPGGSHDVRTRADVADLCAGYGFRSEGLVIAIAVCEAESHFDAYAVNPRSAEGQYGPAVGLFQVRTLVDPSAATNRQDRKRVFKDMMQAGLNVQFAYDLSRGGSNWKPWTTYTNGDYRKYLAAAREEALGTRSPLLTDSARRAPRTVSAVGNDWIDEDQAPLPVVVGGGAAAGDIGNSVVSATLDLSMAEASELQLEIEDENVDLLRRAIIDEGSPLTILGQRHLVTSVGLTQGPGSPHWMIHSQPAGVVRLRGITPSQQAATTALDYVRNLATSAGLRFLGGPMSPTIDVTPATVSLGGTQTIQDLDPATGLLGGTRPENAWEVARRLASETTGYVCFEAAGTLHFATQDWLYENTEVLYVQVGSATFKDQRVPTAVRPIGYPKLTRTIKRDANNAVYPHVTAEMELPAGPGYVARPGMRLWLAEPSGVVRDARPMLIQQVSIAIGDQTKTVRVIAASYTAPGDVEAQPGTVLDDAAGAGAAVGGKPVRKTGRAVDFVNFALAQAGDTYRYGAQTSLTDPDPTEFDCSELVRWAAAQAGVKVVDGSRNQKAACTPISLEQARRTRGALLFLGNPTHHVAISLGDGKGTIEAKGRAYGVVIDKSSRFTSGGLIPGMDYDTPATRGMKAAVPRGAAPVGY